VVWSGLAHHGAGRTLVHRLKYEGLLLAAEVLAAAMAPLVPPVATALVPVPRALLRRWSHGVDAAQVLAVAVGARCGLPVNDALHAALWWRRHAGSGDRRRSPARFRAAAEPLGSWVLIDDVATSGATLDAAAAALGGAVRLAVVASSPSRVRRVGSQHRSPEVGDRTIVAHARRGGGVLLPIGGQETHRAGGGLAAPVMRKDP